MSSPFDGKLHEIEREIDKDDQSILNKKKELQIEESEFERAKAKFEAKKHEREVEIQKAEAALDHAKGELTRVSQQIQNSAKDKAA